MSFERSPEESQEFTDNFGPDDSSDISEDSSSINGGIDTNSDNLFEPSISDQDRYDPDFEGANLERIRREIALKQQEKNERIVSKEDLENYRISSHGDLRSAKGSLYDMDSTNYNHYNHSDASKPGNESKISAIGDSGTRPPEVIKKVRPNGN